MTRPCCRDTNFSWNWTCKLSTSQVVQICKKSLTQRPCGDTIPGICLDLDILAELKTCHICWGSKDSVCNVGTNALATLHFKFKQWQRFIRGRWANRTANVTSGRHRSQMPAQWEPQLYPKRESVNGTKATQEVKPRKVVILYNPHPTNWDTISLPLAYAKIFERNPDDDGSLSHSVASEEGWVIRYQYYLKDLTGDELREHLQTVEEEPTQDSIFSKEVVSDILGWCHFQKKHRFSPPVYTNLWSERELIVKKMQKELWIKDVIILWS